MQIIWVGLDVCLPIRQQNIEEETMKLYCRPCCYSKSVRDRPFNLKGGGGGIPPFFQKHKNSESDYFFFPPPKSEYFFQQHWESEYFFRKKP